MNRYKISKDSLAKAKEFVSTGKKHLEAPNWAVKYKDSLKIKAGKLYFEDRLIIPRENVEAYLRKRIYSKGDDALQSSRDGAHYQLLKETVGITRRNLMEFLKAQKTLGTTRIAAPTPKSKGGKKERKRKRKKK